MTLRERFMLLFGRKTEHKPDPIKADYGRALQRNEIASANAREALEDLRMTETMRSIAGRM